MSKELYLDYIDDNKKDKHLRGLLAKFKAYYTPSSWE